MSETEQAPVEEQPVEQAVVEQAAPPEDENEFGSEVIEVPDSSAENGKVSLVPLAAVKGARAEIKELKQQLSAAKEGSAKAQQLESRIDELSSQLAQLVPKAQAYDAAVAAQHQRPPEPQDDTEAIEFAQALDLYTPEGKPDVGKARKILGVMDHRAQQHARGAVEPLARHTVSQQSRAMLERAKNTAAPNGLRPDPKHLEAVWERLDPSLTATPDGAKQAWAVALGYSTALGTAAQQTQNRGTDGKFTPKEIPEPLHTEKAGGRDLPEGVALNDKERKYLKDAGISEKEYLETAKQAPWLRR